MRINATFVISVLVTTLLLFSCKKEKKHDEFQGPIALDSSVSDFYNLKHYIDSDYAFDLKITSIEVIELKNVFTVQNEKFGKKEKINGCTVNIKFDLKNPYLRIMRIPFPEYFEIGTEHFEGVEFVKVIDEFYFNNSSLVENDKGILLSAFSSYENFGYSSGHIVDFEPNESKSFVIKFTEPFPSKLKQFLFRGFNKYIKREINDLSSMTDDEKQKYFDDESQNYGLLIDLKTKRIINLYSTAF